MADERDTRIGPMSELDDYKVASDDPDPRGWSVIAADGRRIGEVEDLIVDAGARKVRYLDVEVDDELRVDRDHRILIPVGQARLDPDDDNVRVDTLSSTEVQAVPRYSGRWSGDDEAAVRRHFGTDRDATSGTGTSSRFDYEHEHYDETRFYGSRRGMQPGSGGTEPDRMEGNDFTRRNRG